VPNVKIEYARSVRNMAEEYGILETAARLEIKEDSVRRYINSLKDRTAKILIFDIETALMTVQTFHLGKQRINPDLVVKDFNCLSWSAKWLCDSDIKSAVCTPKEAIEHDDNRVIGLMWQLFDKADIIIAHNAFQFDIRRLNYRWLINGFGPPSPYQVVDTLRESRKLFGSASHKLDYYCRMLSLDTKIKTNLELWQECDKGNPEALAEMLEYNKMDVNILEDFYLRIRPWIKGHPNLGLYMESDQPVCRNCGSANLTWLDEYYTSMNRYKASLCECGARGRHRVSDLSKEEKQNLVRNIAY